MAEETRVHVVMIPWSAFGHLIPFFNLSIALAKAGIHVSYISTPRNIQRLPQLPSTLTHLIHLVPIPLPQLENNNNLLLPQGAESTMDIPTFDKFQYLKLAYDKLQHPIRNLVSNWLPNWIICDFSPHWVVDIAHEFHVRLIYYSVFSSPALSLVGLPQKVRPESTRSLLSPERLTVKPKSTFPSTVAFKRHEAIAIVSEAFNKNASGVSDRERFDKIIRASEVVLCRGCYEIDGEYINLYEKLIGKPVIPIGLLPIEKPMKGEISNGASCDDDDKKIFDWLDKQETKSVVFVAFGSECKLTKEQVYEIAFGLELSKLPFLWAIRKPSWAIKKKITQDTRLPREVSGSKSNNIENEHDDGDSDGDSLVPVGFIERTSERGMVCNGWIPQQEILAHPSIGGSLFHSGWGSVIESLQFGHNLVVLPFIFDQPLNARFLVDKGLAIEVERHEDGSFTGHDIAKSLRQAMVLEEGKNIELSVKTREAAAIVGDLKLHRDHYLATFVQFLKDGIWKKKN